MKNWLFVLFQYLIPQHGLSRLVHRISRIRATWFKNYLIRGFSWMYSVDTAEAKMKVPDHYVSFNAFFTRSLKSGARVLPADPLVLASPVDGTISQIGRIECGSIFQAKGYRYDAQKLLGDAETAQAFTDGSFATIYLAPYNYHRIHMPVSGHLEEMRYLPGRLFSVNQATVSCVPKLFTRNERVACRFSTPAGAMAIVLVGALNVGSIETVWAGEVAPSSPRKPSLVRYRKGSISLGRGDEMGRFNMGSTVILLFAPDRVTLDPLLEPGQTLRMGQALGRMEPPH
ncbi:MAG: archaetidylserine decarboxylase [Gammaproteobacteria bacterium]